jgi:3-oxoacyl-[acyl-carrier protein] reductase
LTGQVAVVTGASSGIGRAIALQLAGAGADVVVHAGHNRTGAEGTAATIESSGHRATAILLDLAIAENCTDLVDRAWNWQGHVDVWVNNAGADVLTGRAAELPFAEKLQRLWQVDVLATIGLSRHVGQRMRAQRRGAILNMGWDQAETGMAGDSGQLFAAAKGAVMAFSRSLACTLAPDVRVNCLAPGWIKTSWGDRASEYWQRRAVRESLMQRWGAPEDVARAALFLVSPAAQFLTAQTIYVNGGRNAAHE